MPHPRARWLPAIALVAAAFLAVRNLPADNPPVKENDAESKLVKAESGPLAAMVNLNGIVVADESAEVFVRPKAWAGQLIVRKAVAHGTPVQAGDVLIEFETEKLDKEIRDLKEQRDLAELAIRQAELGLPLLEKQLPLDLASAERNHKRAVEDQRRFIDIDRKTYTDEAEQDVRRIDFYHQSAKEELEQLRKMYRDKDLTEETEQMILRRQEFYVEYYGLYAKIFRHYRDRIVNFELPRREEDLRNAVATSELQLRKARDVDPLNFQEKKLNLAKLRHEQEKSREKLADLEADRELLVVRAPTAGVAYHGRCVRGKWTVPSGSPLITGNGVVNPGDVLMTVVNPRQLFVRADAEDKELARLRVGLLGRATSAAFPDDKLPARLARIAPVPQEDGKFEIRIEPEGDPSDKLKPGMNLSVRFVTARRDEVVSVPASAVFEDEANDGWYVYRTRKSGDPQRHAVRVGLTNGERVEILDGLAAGDEILSAKP